MSSKSSKPCVMNSVTSAPFSSSSALVPRVVARCMSIGGSGWPASVPVAIRAARIGGSTSKAISIAWPSGMMSGSGFAKRSRVGESCAVISIGSPALPSRRKRWPIAKPGVSGCGNSTAISVGESMTVRVPRRQLLERTLKRRVRPCGSAARQSVKVPPVSTQTRQHSDVASVATWLTAWPVAA